LFSSAGQAVLSTRAHSPKVFKYEPCAINGVWIFMHCRLYSLMHCHTLDHY